LLSSCFVRFFPAEPPWSLPSISSLLHNYFARHSICAAWPNNSPSSSSPLQRPLNPSGSGSLRIRCATSPNLSPYSSRALKAPLPSPSTGHSFPRRPSQPPSFVVLFAYQAYRSS
jgi:hypothetical protein